MFRIIVSIMGVMLVCSCAATPERPEKVTGLKVETPGLESGQPLNSPELAAMLAELVLVEQGHDCSDCRSAISFCEGIYTITFSKQAGAGRYEVNIDASNSRILKVTMAVPLESGSKDNDSRVGG